MNRLVYGVLTSVGSLAVAGCSMLSNGKTEFNYKDSITQPRLVEILFNGANKMADSSDSNDIYSAGSTYLILGKVGSAMDMVSILVDRRRLGQSVELAREIQNYMKENGLYKPE